MAIATPKSRCIAPTGTIGLVMDCDTTGVEPDFALVKFKKLAGGGYFKIINASVPAALARLGYTPKQIDDIVRYCRGAGTLQGCPHINPASLKAKGFTDDDWLSIEAQLPGVFELPFAFNRWTLGDDFLRDKLDFTPEQIEAPELRPADRARLHPRAGRRGQRLRLRHHDHRGRAAPEGRNTTRLRLRQQVRQDSASASSPPSRTSA